MDFGLTKPKATAINGPEQPATGGRAGIIPLTYAAESALHTVGLPRRGAGPDQLDELEQVGDLERAAAGGQGDEGVRVRGVGPGARQRALRALLVEEEGPVLLPGPPDGDELELAARPGMERVGYPDDSLPTVAIGRS